MIDLQDPGYCPTLEEIGEYVRNGVFERFCAAVKGRFQAEGRVDFSSCSLERGWNVKFKKSGRALCTIYPKESCFTVMVVVGKKEKEAVEAMLARLSPQVREIYEQTREGNGQRWMMIPIEDQDSVYEDVIRLIEIRRGVGRRREEQKTGID